MQLRSPAARAPAARPRGKAGESRTKMKRKRGKKFSSGRRHLAGGRFIAPQHLSDFFPFPFSRRLGVQRLPGGLIYLFINYYFFPLFLATEALRKNGFPSPPATQPEPFAKLLKKRGESEIQLGEPLQLRGQLPSKLGSRNMKEAKEKPPNPT